MNVNEKAPVVAESELEIVAAPETVWAVLADIEHWPTWNPEVKSMSQKILKNSLDSGLLAFEDRSRTAAAGRHRVR